MSEIIRHSETCQVKNLRNGKIAESVVADFTYQKKLNVVINKEIKLNMVWNGQCYEGRAAGIDFESVGPNVSKSKTGIRG
jgi:hypothetical protein